MLQTISNILTAISDFFIAFYNVVLDVTSFILSILGFLYYAGKTLIVGIYKLLSEIVDGSVWGVVMDSFYSLSDYIGIYATMFIYALFFIVIIRILIAFVFKILRLNLDYKIRTTKGSRKNREPTDYVEDVTYPRIDYKG